MRHRGGCGGRRKAAGTAAVFGKTAFAGFVQEG